MGAGVSALRVETGLDLLVSEDFQRLRGKRIALLANQASVNADLQHILQLLARQDDLELVRIFAPEHGLYSDAQDQVGLDSSSSGGKVPIQSLYGKDFSSLWPAIEDLQDVDLLLADVPDIGSRYYTYFNSLAFCMQKAGEAGCAVMVLDRPNPIGGTAMEGCILDSPMQSFVGYFPIPARHGMTIGELSLLVNGRYGIDAELEVVPMKNWRREMYFDDTGLPWVLPSPNMPTPDTALVYPGGCLVEGSNLSEGRGTTRPFELIGAPGLDSDELCRMLNDEDLPGLRLRPTIFTPTFHKFAGLPCGAVQVHVSDRRTFRPWLTYMLLLSFIGKIHSDFDWFRGTYEFVSDRLAIDLLIGDEALRKKLEAGAGREVFEKWNTPAFEKFKAMRHEVLLYH